MLSTDPAHSLADAFATTVGPEPTEVAPRLFVQQVDAQLRFEQSWAEIQGYLLAVLDAAGLDPVAAEELTVLPGAEEVLALLELRLQVQSGRWDVVVVDCAPTAETLRLLALPEALGWYMQRVLPVQRRVVGALRPVLARAAGVPMPGGGVFDAVERLHAELDEVRALLAGPDASVRLVLTPENLVLAEARRSYTTLSLFGYRVDGVVANRVFPGGGADAWRAGWVAAQTEVLARVAESFAGTAGVALALPHRRAGRGRGAGRAGRGAVRRRRPAGAGRPDRVRSGSSRTGSGAVLHLALPHVTRADVDLGRNGDELVVTVGSYRRLLTLPAGLARHRVAGARVEQGELQVRFVPGTEPERTWRRREEEPVSEAGGRGGREGTAGGGSAAGGRANEERDERVSEPPGTDDPGQRPEEQVGTVSEEAGKLFGALSDWARDQASGTATGGGGAWARDWLGSPTMRPGGRAARAAHDLDEHLATGSAECTWCPLCRAVHAVRQTSPEVRTHLATAASSLLQAAAGLLATAVPQEERAAGTGNRGRADRPRPRP